MILQPSQWAQTFFRGDAASKAPESAEQRSTGSLFVDWSAIPNDLVGLSDEEIGSLPGWYYSVELRPGVFTKGEDFPSAALPRAALSRAEPKGWRCLDIGAMEGLITTVLCRRGAGRVIAYDRPTYTRSKLAAVRRAYERHSTSSMESSWRISAPPFANRARRRSISSSFPASCTTCSTRSAASHMRAASFGTVDCLS